MKHLTAEQLAIYAEALAKDDLQDVSHEIIEHIEECDTCASEAIDFSFILKDNDYSQNKTKIIAPHKSINKFKYYAYAASIVIPLALWLGFYYFKNDNNQQFAEQKENEQIIDSTDNNIIAPPAQNDSTKEENETETESPEKEKGVIIKKPDSNNDNLLAMYEPHSETEKLVNNFKGSLRGDDIEIISKNKIVAGKNKAITLEWKNTEQTELTIEIFDNKAVNIESSETTENNYTVKQKVLPGLYYWKLFNEEFDLLFCGKIVIE